MHLQYFDFKELSNDSVRLFWGKQMFFEKNIPKEASQIQNNVLFLISSPNDDLIMALFKSTHQDKNFKP
ncbi:MAG: hypothetical protein ACPHSE_04120 [Flavobacteriaceae bacterium]